MEFFSGRTAVGVPGVIDDPLKAPRAVRHYITPGFFDTLGIPLRLGREIDARDVQDAPQVAVLSESLARRLWPAEDPIGRMIFADGKRTVVGVVADIASRQLENSTDSQIYFPAEQMAMPSYYWPKDLIVRSSSNAMALAPSLRRIIHEVDPEQAVSNLQLLDDVMNAQTAPRRVQLRVLGTFTVLAFLLAAVGIHGLLSFAVSTRLQEVGIRMALGADRRSIFGIFLRQGIFLAVGGIVLAAPVTYFVVQMLRSLLFGVNPDDPLVYGAAALLALIMTVAGSLRPAIRAAAVDPLVTMRAE
jgi:putative ABC transport system permease protein